MEIGVINNGQVLQQKQRFYMLNLDSVKTRTIYSKHEIQSLEGEFKAKLNQAYESESPDSINNLLSMIRLFYYLSDVPAFLKEFNQVGEIQTLAQLEILFMKCSHWKSHKEIIQKWSAVLLKNIAKFFPSYTIKPMISAMQFSASQEEKDTTFFAFYLDKVSKTKSQFSMFVSISFLRVFLIDQLQNKRREFIFVEKDHISQEWKTINQSLIKICNGLDNLKYEQICVSICYWLCSQNKEFIKECVIKGAVPFLCQTLSNKNVSQWYGRKIISFLKLLLLGLEGKSEFFSSSDLESCVAQFTLKYDNENILQQARSLFSCMNSGEGKLVKQMELYQKYMGEKNPKNLQNTIKSSRVLLLCSEDEKLRKQLNQTQSMDYLYKLIKKQENVYLLTEIFNIISYNNKAKGEKQDDIDFLLIERVSNILTNSKDKNQLVLNNKRLLISLVRMLKQLIQNRQYSQKLLNKIKLQSITKKLSKFSDCTNFRYERELLSLMRLLTSPNKKKEEKSNESLDILKALVKHMNENTKRMGKRLEDELEQLELIHEMLQRGEMSNIKQEVIEGIFGKLKTKKNEVQEVQISILDRSEQERNREIINRINYLAISCLQQLQKNHEKAGDMQVKNQDVQKLIKIGSTTDDIQILKADTSYLILLADHNKLDETQKEKIASVYQRYKERLGQDSELNYKKTNAQEQKTNQNSLNKEAKLKDMLEKLQKSLKQTLNQNQQQQLEQMLLNQQNSQILSKCIEKYSNSKQNLSEQSLTVLLKFILKLSQSDEWKKPIFVKFSGFLKQKLAKASDSDANIIFKIFSELLEENMSSNKQFYSELLTTSYQSFTKQSVEFTSNCLGQLEYSGSESRLDQYWKYIYNTPDMISREAAFLIKEDDSQKSDRFWSFFTKPIEKNIEDEKKLTLHFLQRVASRITKETWQRFQIDGILEKLVFNLDSRNSEIHTKAPTEVLLRKLLRLSKAFRSCIQNQFNELPNILPTVYQNVTGYLTTNPSIKSSSQKLNSLSEQYNNQLLQILKATYKRRDGYSVARKQLKIYEQVCACMSQYKSQRLNDSLTEIYRILLLRDDRHQQFQEISGMLQKTKPKIGQKISEKGKENLKSCERIIEAVKNNNEANFKKEYLDYFFPGQSTKENKKVNVEFTDQQLIKHVKNLLNPPYQYSLNFLEKHLRLIQNADFAKTLIQVFIQSAELVKDDKQNSSKTLEEVQQKIVDSIWGQGCELSPDFYKMINMNLIGLRVCLKMKGIGMEGAKIVCEKFYEYPDEIPLCAEILYLNVTTSKEWAVALEKKIPELVNLTYKSKGRVEAYGRSLANLVGSSSKLKTIQNQYKIQNDLFSNLQYYENNIPCAAATLYAISGLGYLNQQNQKILCTKECLRTYVKVIEKNGSSPIVFDKGCNLLSNMVYKNVGLIKVYVELGIDMAIIKVATTLLYQYSAYKQFLRLIGNISLSSQAANSITKTQFLYLWGNILKEAEAQKHEDIIKYCFDIIFNLLNYPEVQAKPFAYRTYQAGCIERTIQICQRNCLVTSIIESGLDSLEKMLLIDAGVKKATQSGVLKTLEDIANTQSWNETILQKWIKVLYELVTDEQAVKNHILKSEVLGKLATFIKQHPELKQQYLSIVVSMTDIVGQKGDKTLFYSSGFIDLLVELLKLKYLKAINASSIIDFFMKLHQEGALNQSSYVKIFGGLMCRLEFEFRDENSKKIISAITKIRDHIIINTRAATILLEFSYVFLTQSEIITSQKYHKRVRQFICLLSYFLSFSIELKIIFREEGFLQILNSWMKIDKSLDEDNSVSEACRVCIFTIQNEQKALVNSSEYKDKREQFYEKLQLGSKCLLYRRDHSNKDAFIKVRPFESKMQLVSYKAPDGEIKQKYIIPVRSVIGLRCYEKGQDNLFKQSVFSNPKSIFQKSSIAEKCLTVVGIVGQQLSIRQIDVQFETQEARDEFVTMLKLMIRIEFKTGDYKYI